MESNEILDARKQAALQIRHICSEYGLYGNVISYQPSNLPESDRNRMYIVAGTHPDFMKDSSPTWYYPEDIVRRIERNKKLFYPAQWAFDLHASDNQLKATEALVEYCKKAEFVKLIYAEYGLNPPDRIRESELNQLINAWDSIQNPLLNQKTKDKYKRDLDWFFKREKSTGFRRKWLDYFRSDKFPDDKGPIAKVRGYFRRSIPETQIYNLMEVNDDLHKLQMQEHEYKLFKKFIQEVYPDVSYAVSEKEIVNHGGVHNEKHTESALGRRITGEEFAVIRKERFAKEGWAALENLKPAYWEFRDIHYKACDEPLIAAAYNSITLQYAKCDPLADLNGLSPLHLIDIPVTDFMNFVSLAKANNLRFYIDNIGEYAIPSLENIHVIYNEHQSEKLQSILNRMMGDKVEFSHMVDEKSRPGLSEMIHDVEKLRPKLKHEHIIERNHERD